jgi:hypothetical protein
VGDPGLIMERLIAFLSRYVSQPDKVLHLLAGAAVALVALVLAMWCGLALGAGQLVALWAGCAVAWFKERCDRAYPLRHTWDGWDAFATFLGALVAVTAIAVGTHVHDGRVRAPERTDGQKVLYVARQGDVFRA